MFHRLQFLVVAPRNLVATQHAQKSARIVGIDNGQRVDLVFYKTTQHGGQILLGRNYRDFLVCDLPNDQKIIQLPFDEYLADVGD